MEVVHEEVPESAWEDPEHKRRLKDARCLLPRVEGDKVILMKGNMIGPHELVVSDNLISVAYAVILAGTDEGLLVGLAKRNGRWEPITNETHLTDEELFQMSMAIHGHPMFRLERKTNYSDPAYLALEALST